MSDDVISPDGKFRWDGNSWAPIQPETHPLQSLPQNHQFHQVGYLTPVQAVPVIYNVPQKSQKPHIKKISLIIAGVFFLIITSVTLAILTTNSDIKQPKINFQSYSTSYSLGSTLGLHDALVSFTLSYEGKTEQDLNQLDFSITVDGKRTYCSYSMQVNLGQSMCVYVAHECLKYSNVGPLNQVSMNSSYGNLNNIDFAFTSSHTEFVELSTSSLYDFNEQGWDPDYHFDSTSCYQSNQMLKKTNSFVLFEVNLDICQNECEIGFFAESQDSYLVASVNQMDTDVDGFDDFMDYCTTIFGASTNDVLGCPDPDGDGYSNINDLFPNDSAEWFDSDSDGVGDNFDAFPLNESEWTDTDQDGVGDNSDAFPTNVSEWLDSDGDGIGDNSDILPTGDAVFSIGVYALQADTEQVYDGDESAPDIYISVMYDVNCNGDLETDLDEGYNSQGVNNSYFIGPDDNIGIAFDIPDAPQKICFRIFVYDFDGTDSELLDYASGQGSYYAFEKDITNMWAGEGILYENHESGELKSVSINLIIFITDKSESYFYEEI